MFSFVKGDNKIFCCWLFVDPKPPAVMKMFSDSLGSGVQIFVCLEDHTHRTDPPYWYSHFKGYKIKKWGVTTPPSQKWMAASLKIIINHVENIIRNVCVCIWRPVVSTPLWPGHLDRHPHTKQVGRVWQQRASRLKRFLRSWVYRFVNPLTSTNGRKDSAVRSWQRLFTAGVITRPHT